MRSVVATSHLLVAGALAGQRGAWMRPGQVEIEIGSDLSGRVSSRWYLDAGRIGTVADNYPVLADAPVLIPFTAENPGSADQLRVFMEQTASRQTEVIPQPLDSLVEASGDRHVLPKGFADNAFLFVDRAVLDGSVGFRVCTSTTATTKRVKSEPLPGPRWRAVLRSLPRHRPHPIKAVSPIGLMTIEPAAGFAPHQLVVSLPPELQVDSVVLHLGTGIEAIIEELEALHRYYDDTDAVREVDGRMAGYLVGHVRDGVDLAKQRLSDLGDGLDKHAPCESGPATERLRRGIADLDEVAERLDRLVADASATTAARTRLEDLDEIVVAALAALDRSLVVQVRCQLQPSGRLDACTALAGFEVREVVLAYSADTEAVLAQRPGTRFSLMAIIVLLLLIGWRIADGLMLHPSITAAQSDDFTASRDSIVAILLVAPALLSTQVDRLDPDKHTADRSIGMLLAVTRVAVFAPYVVAVMALGRAQPELVVEASFVSAVFVFVALVALATALSNPFLQLARRRSCRRELRRPR